MRRFDTPWARLTAPTLAARRLRVRLRRIACACAAAAAVLMVWTMVDARTMRVDVVVTTRDVTRGETLHADDVRAASVPVSALSEGAVASVDAASGKVAQADLARGQPLYPTLIRAAPAVPRGNTVLEVTVANDVSSLVAGDRVSLVSAVGCEGAYAGEAFPEASMGERSSHGADSPDADAETSDDAQVDGAQADGAQAGGAQAEAGTTTVCLLASDALAMGRAEPAPDGATGGTVTLALSPDEALNVMAAAPLGAIVTVETQ